jgi:hypothetical protein
VPLQGGRYLPCRLDATQLQIESADSEASKLADLKSQIDPRDKLRKSMWDHLMALLTDSTRAGRESF